MNSLNELFLEKNVAKATAIPINYMNGIQGRETILNAASP
jgi:hypothetical protein